MAKAKASKGLGSVPNKALHSRVSYLYQAATYLATQQQHSKAVTENSTNAETTEAFNMATHEPQTMSKVPLQSMSRRLISDLRNVSLKAQMRMSPAMKHTMCKHCDTLLVDGSTCTSEVENRSKGRKKPWADILVRRCSTCGFEGRFPLAAERQKRRPLRSAKNHKATQNDRVTAD